MEASSLNAFRMPDTHRVAAHNAAIGADAYTTTCKCPDPSCRRKEGHEIGNEPRQLLWKNVLKQARLDHNGILVGADAACDLVKYGRFDLFADEEDASVFEPERSGAFLHHCATIPIGCDFLHLRYEMLLKK
jgi:hypothetical protein